MQNPDKLQFPAGFLWGTATSSHQVEGNNRNNQWWDWEQLPGKVWHGDRSGLACDWWRNAERDFALMQELHMQTHRLSVEWSRIEPQPGQFDHLAIDRYRAMLGDLHARGIEPMVTLHHFTNPLWLERAGGWEQPQVVARFQNFVRYTVAELGDLCDLWLTINEPLVYVAQGWFRGIWPPQRPNPLLALRVYRHLLLAHGVAYRTIHALRPQAKVGAALAIRHFLPSNPQSRLDRFASGIKRYIGDDIWLQSMRNGRVRFPLGMNGYHHALDGSLDFIGVNYYTRDLVRFVPDPLRLFGEEHFRPDGEFSDSGRRGIYSEFYPEGLYQVIRNLDSYGVPVYVTENGLPDHDDDQRPRWLLAHIAQVQRAISEGSDVRGYYHWTFTDNFEWSEGWGLRFGLVDVDPVTQERTVRPSGRMFAAIARDNGITRDLAAQYAPELLATLFREPSRSNQATTS
jgi:beta-glucosidase